jgi:hypothetical protein
MKELRMRVRRGEEEKTGYVRNGRKKITRT